MTELLSEKEIWLKRKHDRALLYLPCLVIKIVHSVSSPWLPPGGREARGHNSGQDIEVEFLMISAEN